MHAAPEEVFSIVKVPFLNGSDGVCRNIELMEKIMLRFQYVSQSLLIPFQTQKFTRRDFAVVSGSNTVEACQCECEGVLT